MVKSLRFLPLLAALALGCSQGEGDRCEVDTDCETGLMCMGNNPNQKVCTSEGSVARDAGTGVLPEVAPEARPPEVAPEAPPEAGPSDAGPTMDVGATPGDATNDATAG